MPCDVYLFSINLENRVRRSLLDPCRVGQMTRIFKKNQNFCLQKNLVYLWIFYTVYCLKVFFFTFKHTVHKFNIRILLILGGNLHILAVLITTQHFGHFCLRHTPRYSIRSSPIRPNFRMTTFKAKNVFLVLGMGHNMNIIVYYEK